MARSLGWAAAGSAAFVLALIARYPARWAGWALPRGSDCRALSGTLWSGTCADLSAARTPLGELRWRFEPARLLLGRLSLEVTLTRSRGSVHARIELSPSGTITASGLRASVGLDHALLAELPVFTRAAVQANLASVSWRDGNIRSIQGEIDVTGLATAQGEPLGAYRIVFPGGTIGRLSDLGGPFSVEGTVRLTPGPGYLVSGRVAARPDAPSDLARQLRYLGAADAEGRREFSFEGTF
jgi:general secretion pathway protein N